MFKIEILLEDHIRATNPMHEDVEENMFDVGTLQEIEDPRQSESIFQVKFVGLSSRVS